LGGRTNHHKREEAIDKGKDLGIQTMLESIVKKELKGTRGKSGFVPPRGRAGGKSLHPYLNNENCLQELQRLGEKIKERNNEAINQIKKA